MFEKELQEARAAVRQASRICTSVQSSLEPDALTKKDRSPVTVADFGSQALICRALETAFPGDPIVAEESSAMLRDEQNTEILDRLVYEVKRILPKASVDDILSWIDHGSAREYSDRFWTLDPIDGTKGFLRGDQYAVALSLLVEGQLTVSALACPNLDFDAENVVRLGKRREESLTGVIFYALRGNGAFAVPIEGDAEPVRIRVSPQKEPARIRFCESVESAHSSHSSSARIAERLGITESPVRVDSQTKYGIVACGAAEAYLRLPKNEEYREKIWDHAGGALVVEEAGGRVSDIQGRPLDFTRGRQLVENRGVIVSNGTLHEPILEAIRHIGLA